MKKSPVSSINYVVALAILSAMTDVNLVNAVRRELKTNGKPCELFNVRRSILFDMYGVTAKTVVYADAWDTMLKIRKVLFDPADYGANGKYVEVKDRLELYTMNGQSKTTWSEFNAHKPDKKDITDKVEGGNIEKKSGAGDWISSKRSNTLEKFRKEYSRKVNDVIRWDVEKTVIRKAGKRTPERTVKIEIHWEKSWQEFFDTLELFNGDLQTWFKKEIVSTESGYKLQLQEFQNSDKKIAFLMEHNDR